MKIEQARQEVLTAGLELVQTGLIARTWGNVSCRIDENRFAITPSGRAYETLRPEDIVIVNIADLSYEGNLKPSSEKGIHATVYRLKPDINFVIHTHQENATIAGLLGKDIEILDAAAQSLIGKTAVIAEYGLPGTKKLRENIAKALKRSESHAVFMKYHGALCFGQDREKAFATAQALEAECLRFVAGKAASGTEPPLKHSRREGDAMIFDTEGASQKIDLAAGRGETPEAELHRAVYNARSDLNVIIGTSQPFIVHASSYYKKIKPLMDDFAQIVGSSVSSVPLKPEETGRVIKALKGRNAVMLYGLGALCCAGDAGDAAAVEMVLEKGCKAYASVPAGTVKPISLPECVLMRFVYQNKYAKLKKKK